MSDAPAAGPSRLGEPGPLDASTPLGMPTSDAPMPSARSRFSPPASSLPPSSPPAFSNLGEDSDAGNRTGEATDDDEELDSRRRARVVDEEREARALGDEYDHDEPEDDEGEDLFGDNMNEDYTFNRELDTYEGVGVDDESAASMDATTRRLAEMRMTRRDRAERAQRGTDRSRAPAFLQSDDESDMGDGIMRRRRRHYDEAEEDEMAEDVRSVFPSY